MKYNDYETLMGWATVPPPSNIHTESAYMDTLTKVYQEKRSCCRKIYPPIISNAEKGKRFFPTLLIFHTLIVLVLAFVTQLIISDKSVTEPL